MHRSVKFLSLALAAMFLISETVAAADEIAQVNTPPESYKTTYDNIPADWEEFWLDDESIYSFLGDPVDGIYMTQHAYGEHGDGVQLAGGAYFTVISPLMMLVQNEEGITQVIEFRYCRGLDRAKYLVLSTEAVEIKFRRNSILPLMTAQTRGLIRDCRIEEIYDWHGPTFYVDDIVRPTRTYRARRRR